VLLKLARRGRGKPRAYGNVRVVRIDRKALAEATSVLVATHAEWHGEDIPGRAQVV
jgi:hypothetical protein